MIPNDKPIFRVSQVANFINISSDRLRTYDEEYLVAPFRDGSGTRLYSNLDVEWLEDLRLLITKDKLSVFGFKEILRLLYFIPDSEFEKFIKNQEPTSIWFVYKKCVTIQTTKSFNISMKKRIYQPINKGL